MTKQPRRFYDFMKPPRIYDPSEFARLLELASEARVTEMGNELGAYLERFLPETLRRKKNFTDYKTNPYVFMTTAHNMRLEEPTELAMFLVNLKLYMGLETSFGKSLESVVIGHYPIDEPNTSPRWAEPPEKRAEFDSYEGLDREAKARARNSSIWREVDKACVVGRRRHLLTIKSGPSTINDTQVEAMKNAIRDQHLAWLEASQSAFDVEGIDVVVGLTYGTPRTTNNKENQILVKLMESGFDHADPDGAPGVLVNNDGTVRVYRKVGIDFWSYVGAPDDPSAAEFVFVEVLLALAKALREGAESRQFEDIYNERLEMLAKAILELRLPRESVPKWVKESFTPAELNWLAAAASAFFDPVRGNLEQAEEAGRLFS